MDVDGKYICGREDRKMTCNGWRTQHHPDRSFLRGDSVLPSSRLLFTCSAVGEGGTYPGSTVVKELFENTRPPEDRTGDTVPVLVGVEG